jgi:hypothetical protein
MKKSVLTTGILFATVMASVMLMEKLISGQPFNVKTIITSLVGGLVGGFAVSLMTAKSKKK